MLQPNIYKKLVSFIANGFGKTLVQTWLLGSAVWIKVNMSKSLHGTNTEHASKLVSHSVYIINIHSVSFIQSNLGWGILKIWSSWILQNTHLGCIQQKNTNKKYKLPVQICDLCL